jgi:hypothetical protein
LGFLGRDVPLNYVLKAIFLSSRDFIVLFYGLVIFKSVRDIERFYKFLIPIVFIICLYGFYEYITKENPFSYLVSDLYNEGETVADHFKNDIRGVINGRIQAFTAHPLIHGQLMELVFAFVLIFKREKNTGTLILLFFVFLNVVLAGSRASLIGTILFIILVSLSVSRKTFVVLLIALMPVLAFSGGGGSNNVTQTFKSMVFFWDSNSSSEIQGSSVESRTIQYAYMITDLGNKILIGHGKGYIKFDNDKNGEHPIMHGYESIVLKEVTEIGLVGLSFFIIWYFKIYRLLKEIAAKCNNLRRKDFVKYLFLTYLISLLLTGDWGSTPFFFLFVELLFIQMNLKIQYAKINDKNSI